MTLSLNNVSFEYGGRSGVVDLNIRFGERRLTAICGPNGSGKSTTLSLAAGTMAPQLGAVRLDGIPLSNFSLKSLAQRRAFVGQHSDVAFPYRVFQLVEMGLAIAHSHLSRAELNAVVLNALSLVELVAFKDRSVHSLSGGELKRVQLARAFAQLLASPESDTVKWLLLDEPTASLDLKHQIQLLNVLRECISRAYSVIVVLHDLHFVQKYTDDVILMKDGQVFAAGETQEIFSPGHINEVFELPDHVHVT